MFSHILEQVAQSNINMKDNKQIISIEEQERKETVKFRFLWVLIILNILLIGYIAYQIVSAFIG